MGFLKRLAKESTEVNFLLLGFDTIYSLVKKWKPKHFNSESAYQDDLLKYLNDKLITQSTKEKVVKIKRVRGDIVIGKICVEMKYNATSTGSFDRLASQIERYKKVYKHGIVLVLCGRTDKDLLKKYKSKLFWGTSLVPLKIIEK